MKNNNFIYSIFKRIADIVLSFTAILVLLPFFILFCIIVWLTDFGNPFYLQKRVGRNGKAFYLIKYRTMYTDSDNFAKYFTKEQMESFNTEFKLENDPRITPFGRIMRKYSIDELPQFLNVLSGNMSIIGPRPLVEAELDNYGQDRDKLLSVRPGITGLWQVSGRNLLTYESGERQKCELKYVENYGFKLDMCVFFKTFKAIFDGRGI